VELERRAGPEYRLFVDFTAYTPGSLVLPELKIWAGDSILVFSNIIINIASILTGDALILGSPAPPLTVPGTSFLVYGVMALFFCLILAGLGLRFRGMEKIAGLLARSRRRRLLRGMEKLLHHLRNSLTDDASEAEVLRDAVREFRTVLTVFTGVYCGSLTAGEFRRVSLPFGSDEILSGPYLCGIFRRCDALRFSGTCIPRQETMNLLEDIRGFIDALSREERRA
jgi:hypothetical protein